MYPQNLGLALVWKLWTLNNLFNTYVEMEKKKVKIQCAEWEINSLLVWWHYLKKKKTLECRQTSPQWQKVKIWIIFLNQKYVRNLNEYHTIFWFDFRTFWDSAEGTVCRQSLNVLWQLHEQTLLGNVSKKADSRSCLSVVIEIPGNSLAFGKETTSSNWNW